MKLPRLPKRWTTADGEKEIIGTVYTPKLESPDLSYMETNTELDPITYAAAIGEGVNLTYGNIPEEVKQAYANGTVYTPPQQEPEIPTYEQWLQGLKDETIRKAKSERDRAISDAEYSYARYLNPYGAHAEAMSNAGLGNTGYSDYLKGNAYTTMREEIGKANAAYADAERAADLSYAENLYKLQESDKLKMETKQAQDLPNYITNAQNGQYTSEQIEKIITDNGYTGADADALRGAFKQYEQGQNLNIADISSKISNSEFDSWAVLESYAKAADLDPDSFKDEYINFVANEINTSIESGYLMDASKLGEIEKLAPEKYKELVQKYNSEILNSIPTLFGANDEYLTEDDAKELLRKLESDQFLDVSTKEALKDKYKELYEGGTAFATIERDDSNLSGNKFILTAPDINPDNDIKVRKSEEVAESYFGSFVKSIEDNTLFVYRNNIYLKGDGKYFLLEKRDSYGDDWNRLIRYFNIQNTN